MMIPLSCAVHRCTSHGTYLSDLGFRFRFKFRFVLNAMHMYTIKTYIIAYYIYYSLLLQPISKETRLEMVIENGDRNGNWREVRL